MTAMDFPTWDEKDPKGSVDRLYEWTVHNAQSLIGWYDRGRRPKRIFAQLLLGTAVFLGGVGLLCPLIEAACKDCSIPLFDCSISLPQVGYIVIAIAGIIVVYDRTYGLSSGWMRFMETQLKLEQALNEFHLSWTQAVAVQVPEDKREEHLQELLIRLRDFHTLMNTLVMSETNLWMQEFRRSLTGIEESLRKDK